MMKMYFMLLIVSVFVGVCTVNAQLVKQKVKIDKQSERDWYNCSFDKDGVYGACVNEAYEFLKGKKVKARPIVALIGTGIDLEHEALKANLWKNAKDKPDGKDNDKNGYVDDVNGWNFIGGKDGQVMSFVTREGEREFLRLKDKYGDIIKDGSTYYSFASGKPEVVEAPRDMKEFDYYRFIVLKESRLANTYGSQWMSRLGSQYIDLFDKEIRAKFPDKKDLTVEDILINCQLPNPKQDSSLRNYYLYSLNMASNFFEDKSWEFWYKRYMDESRFVKLAQKYKKEYEKFGDDGRKIIVGDNYLDVDDRVYGNNVLLTSDAMVGTMMAGVITGSRGVEGRNNPIADQAEIMTLVVQAGEGEPYLKDMALAIRYAVDHEASIIVLPQQNTFYPEGQKQWISEAIRYAEKKGALVIVPVLERSWNLSEITFYPNRWMDGEKEITNLITIAVSDKNGMPSPNSNFGSKELDIFAPGLQILSTSTGDTYQMGSGMALASATVAGVAALIKTYYPKLTGSQIRDILLKTVTSRRGVEVEKSSTNNGEKIVDLYLFEQLCLSGGIVNALEAVKAADKLNRK